MKEADEEMAKLMQPDIVLMDRYQGELRELDKKIATQSGMLAGGGKSLWFHQRCFVLNRKNTAFLAKGRGGG